jgi:hypothetical protein
LRHGSDGFLSLASFQNGLLSPAFEGTLSREFDLSCGVRTILQASFTQTPIIAIRYDDIQKGGVGSRSDIWY